MTLPKLPFLARLLARGIPPSLVARIASEVAATAGDEIIERLARASTREQLNLLRDALSPAQFAMAIELHDVLRAYAARIDERAVPPNRATSSNRPN